jgi:hypothetical protein
MIPSVMETTGCGTAIVTPFRADRSIDESALRALVNCQIDSGVDFLVACGSTGEAARQAEIARPFARVPAVSIGPITSRTLRELGWEPAVEANPSDIPGLIAAVERCLKAPRLE